MLNSWKTYLLAHFSELHKIDDFGILYEQFITKYPKFRKQWGVYYIIE